MCNLVNKYCAVVRHSSNENDNAIHLLFENRLYKKVIGTLREELELYIKTLYLLNQNKETRDRLLLMFSRNHQWINEKGKFLTDRKLLDFTSRITGTGWEQISYKFACYFIHFSILHNWEVEDITTFVNVEERQTIVTYINNYHDANLTKDSSFEDIIPYSLKIFDKIKGNLECYLRDLELENYD